MGPSEQGCWRHAEVHGLGGIGSVCPEGQEQNGAMCYPGCKDGYGGAGPECWQRCPEGFRDDGAYCAKPGAYGRGVGYFREQKCTDQNSQGCEKWGLLWYPKCKGGFHAVGCCVCSPDCPSGMQDIGIACWKQTYGRGLGSFAQCAAGEEGSLGLCYPACEDKAQRLGPLCWEACPAQAPVACGGALCVADLASCSDDLKEAAAAVGKLVADGQAKDWAAALADAKGDVARLPKKAC